jgi:hypothetical protein
LLLKIKSFLNFQIDQIYMICPLISIILCYIVWSSNILVSTIIWSVHHIRS